MLSGDKLSVAQSDEFVAALVEELDVSTTPFGPLDDLRRDDFASFMEISAASWLTQEDIRGPEEAPCTILLTKSELGGFNITLYPQEGRQVTQRQHEGRLRAMARLNQLAQIKDPPPALAPLSPRGRLSALAERLPSFEGLTNQGTTAMISA